MADERTPDAVWIKLLSWMLDVARPVSDDRHYPEYKIFHIEIRNTGFSISARRISEDVPRPYWEIRDFHTYNA